MIDRGIEKTIAAVLTVIVTIWGIVMLVLSLGIFSNNITDATQMLHYSRFLQKVEAFALPIVIACLALVPVINEDMKIISYISYGLALITLFISLFTSGISSTIYIGVLIIDIIILIVCTVRTSSSIHKVFKYIMFGLITLTIFVNIASTKTAIEDIYSDTYRIEEKEPSKAPIILMGFTFIGILLNPCIALVTEDDSYSLLYGSSGGSTNKTDRRENESPLEMYNRLLAEQKQASGMPAPEGASVAPVQTPASGEPPVQSPGPRPLGPNSGAVINPLAARENQTPAAPVAPAPVASPNQENFEVPSSMAFLFEDNEDKNK